MEIKKLLICLLVFIVAACTLASVLKTTDVLERDNTEPSTESSISTDSTIENQTTGGEETTENEETTKDKINGLNLEYPEENVDYGVADTPSMLLPQLMNPEDFCGERYSDENLYKVAKNNEFISENYRLGIKKLSVYEWSENYEIVEDGNKYYDINVTIVDSGCIGVKNEEFSVGTYKNEEVVDEHAEDFDLIRMEFKPNEETGPELAIKMSFSGGISREVQSAAYDMWAELVGKLPAKILTYKKGEKDSPLYLNEYAQIGIGDEAIKLCMERKISDDNLLYVFQMTFPKSTNFEEVAPDFESNAEEMYRKFFFTTTLLMPEKIVRERQYRSIDFGLCSYSQIDGYESYRFTEMFGPTGEIIVRNDKVAEKHFGLHQGHDSWRAQEGNLMAQLNELTNEAAVYVNGLQFPENISEEEIIRNIEEAVGDEDYKVISTIPYDMSGTVETATVQWTFRKTMEDGIPYCSSVRVAVHSPKGSVSGAVKDKS